ncbi:MAG: hypothetical protein N5P05_000400 [Chroococcopsis gigantea SAG 12.99]|jgi:hypothetical protein|nr:hypothetical protein [Chroococcopsis gigantea SAG 12.99]
MTKKVIGMLSSYQGLKDQHDWLWRQTPQHFGVWKNIQMRALAIDPDFLLMYQFDFPEIKPKPGLSWKQRLLLKLPEPPVDVHSLLRNVPREKIIYLLREPPLPEIAKVNEANYNAARKYCGYISGPDNFAPVPDYMPAIWYVGNSFAELEGMPPPEKEKSVCWITSGIARTANHRQRLGFIQLLRESGFDFDLYGRDLPPWSGSKGSLLNKWSGMAPYYYNLSIENYADNDLYVSEKLWDALLCWCLPIYHGGPAADKLLPPGSFLRLPSLDEKGLAYIREITSTNDAWHEARSAIAEARQIILHKLNLLQWLSDFADKFS